MKDMVWGIWNKVVIDYSNCVVTQLVFFERIDLLRTDKNGKLKMRFLQREMYSQSGVKHTPFHLGTEKRDRLSKWIILLVNVIFFMVPAVSFCHHRLLYFIHSDINYNLKTTGSRRKGKRKRIFWKKKKKHWWIWQYKTILYWNREEIVNYWHYAA